MKTKGATVWNHQNGWTSPKLEIPPTGQVTVFVDYPNDDLSMPIVEPDVEELLSSLGYVGEGRYIGENNVLNPLETKTVTYVDTFPVEDLSHHISILHRTKIPLEWFYNFNSDETIINIKKAIVLA